MIRAVFIVIGLLAPLLMGVVVLSAFGTVPALLGVIPVLALGFYTAYPSVKARRTLRSLQVAISVLSLVMVLYGITSPLSMFKIFSGSVAPADQQALSSARARIKAQAGDKATFRLELTEKEITALLQNQLAGVGAPFHRVVIDVIDGEDEAGYIEFHATFRNGKLAMRGRLHVVLDAGALRVELHEVDVGAINVPGIAKGVVEDLINPFVERALTKNGAEIQSVTFADDTLIIVGRQKGGKSLSSTTLTSRLQRQAASFTRATEPPLEKLGPGVVNGREAQGSSYYVALGDSLAANVGVTEPRDGYVSRFHNQLQRRDGVQYGLRNFSVPGETSASLIRSGQLHKALEYIRSHDVRYITINIGANDLLGHLSSADCSEGLSTPVCHKRIAAAFTAYAGNLERIFRELRQAVPDATVIFLQTYNPVSFGFGARVALEGESNRMVSEFNSLAARIAQSQRILVADGFTPMQGTTTVTTHILDNPPDIHPRAIGFDILAAALLDALPNNSQLVNPRVFETRL